VASLLDVLGISEPAIVGGLSMGGYVALAFARRFTGRLRGLILADTRAEADGAEAKANRDRLIAFTRSHSVLEVFGQLLTKLLSEETRSRRPEVVEEVRKIAAAQCQDGVIAALQALRDRPDATPHLKAVKVPTLVLVGSDDALTPPEMARVLAAGITGSQMGVIEGAGHLANLEQPEMFNTTIRAFLERLG
jgi:3-oxoadipate enol-lactonase